MKKHWSALALFCALTSTAFAQAPGHAVQNQAFGRVTDIQGMGQPDGQLASDIAQLRQRASSGDAKAASALASGLAECKGANSSPNGVFYTSHCVGLTNTDFEEIGKWLTLAAKLGDKEAQYGFAAGGFSDVVGVQNAENHPQVFAAYKATARGYLLNLAQDCNFSAIGAIAGNAASNGLLFGDDPVTGYKFLLVQGLIARPGSPLAVGGTSYASNEAALLKRIGNSPALTKAHQDAVQFAAEQCK